MSDHEHRDERTDGLGAVVGVELSRRVDDLHRPALTLGDVRRRAHRIRRNRRAGALALVAAVVAAVVLPVSLLNGPDRADRIVPAPMPARTAPGASVLHDGGITTPEGRTIALGLDTTDVSAFGVLTDGRVVAALSSERLVRVYSPAGEPEGDHPVSTTWLEMSSSDSAAAWVDPEGRVQVLESGSAGPVQLARLPHLGRTAWSVVSVLGQDCAAGRCEVLATGSDETRSVTLEDTVPVGPSPGFRITDVSPDGAFWAVDLAPLDGDQYGCAALFDVTGATVVARACKTSNLEFSPDGQHLFGARYDGGHMTSYVHVLDKDLQQVGFYEPGRDTVVAHVAWQDDGHLLVAEADLEGTAWTWERMSLDASQVEVLSGPVPGPLPETGTAFLPSR